MTVRSRSAIAQTWAKWGPNRRFAAGAALIALVGVLGLTPKAVGGMDLPWPYAALWGAAGWGAAGLSFRPMFALAAFGVAQDLFIAGPIGSFMLVNLAAYGVSAAIAQSFDVYGDPAARILAPCAAIGAGVAALWVLASGTADYAVKAAPLAAVFVSTALIYFLVAPVFRLGARSVDIERA